MKTIIKFMRVVASFILIALTGFYLPMTAQKTVKFAAAVENPFGLILPEAAPGVTYSMNTNDLDGDGDIDILVAATKFNAAAQIYEPAGMLFYENIADLGCPPEFELMMLKHPFNLPADFLRSPVFVDIDGDGDLDLFSSSACDCEESSLLFFENVNGTFSGQIDVLNPFDIQPSGIRNALPSFTDIDGDGDLDMFMSGHKPTGNRFWFFKNIGTPQAPKFAKPVGKAFKLEPPEPFSPHPILPSWGDMDCDGDSDLLVDFPDENGQSRLYFYENKGTATNPVFPGFVKVGRDFLPMNNIHDFDWDGDLDVLTVNALQKVVFYKNITTGNTCVNLSLAPSADYSFEKEGFLVEFTDQSFYTAECATSWHWDFGDGQTSSEQNPVHVYKLKDRYKVCLTVETPIGSHTSCKSVPVRVAPAKSNFLADEDELRLSPNPAGSMLYLELETAAVSEFVIVDIFDQTGQRMKSLQIQLNSTTMKEAILLDDLRGGVYTARVQSNDKVYSRKFLKL